MRSEYLVPLPQQAVALLREIAEHNPYRKSGNDRFGRYFFQVASSRTCTISENRMLDILYRMGLRGKATVHSFRGLASTVLTSPAWSSLTGLRCN